jgi:anhydro-N-acetylmuramic acid kinase
VSDAVCSHGHTILHQPHNGFTLQIGNLPQIATLVGETVVCDFRVQDVELGGQGAPLVPVGDRLLFAEYDYCLNLGGFSNVSFEHGGKRLAFDIAPVNTVLNFYANQLGLDYDDGGKIARTGNRNEGLFAALNALDYYQKPFPKSLGFEYVKTVVLPLLQNYPIALEDKLHTFTEHIAYQTAKALPNQQGKMLVTGGGAYNCYLMERMQHYVPQLQLIIPEEKTLEFKEALIFALLGVLKLRNEINVLCTVTGALHDHSSGMIYPAKA